MLLHICLIILTPMRFCSPAEQFSRIELFQTRRSVSRWKNIGLTLRSGDGKPATLHGADCVFIIRLIYRFGTARASVAPPPSMSRCEISSAGSDEPSRPWPVVPALRAFGSGFLWRWFDNVVLQEEEDCGGRHIRKQVQVLKSSAGKTMECDIRWRHREPDFFVLFCFSYHGKTNICTLGASLVASTTQIYLWF